MAAILAEGCAGKVAAPPANPFRAGAVVAAANRAEAAGRKAGPSTAESNAIDETPQALEPTYVPTSELPAASSKAAQVNGSGAVPAETEEAPAPTTGTVLRLTATPFETPLPATATPSPPITTAPATETPTPASAPAPQFTVLENANVRAGPGTDYPVIGGLAAGETFPIVARSADTAWLQFGYLGAAGWVSAGLVRQAGDFGSVGVALNVPPPPPTATRVPPTPTSIPGPSDPVIADLVARINQARTNAGLKPLRWTPELAQAAGAHTWDMATHHFFSHTGSDGSDVTVRMRRAGYVPVYWGEILAHVNGGGGPDAAFNQFWNSPHHHDIIMGNNFNDVGAAWIKDPADGSFSYYAVVFGRR